MCLEILLFITKCWFKILRSFSRNSNDNTQNIGRQHIVIFLSLYFLSKLMKELDKQQANLIIVVLGLSKYCHTTHLMQATRIKPISHTIQILSLDLLWTCILKACLHDARFLAQSLWTRPPTTFGTSCSILRARSCVQDCAYTLQDVIGIKCLVITD